MTIPQHDQLPTDDAAAVPARTTNGIFILCECCMLKLVNDDESGCRDFHRHTHAPLDVPADAVLTQGPHHWDGSLDVTCHGHADGFIRPGEDFWVAEVVRDDPADGAQNRMGAAPALPRVSSRVT